MGDQDLSYGATHVVRGRLDECRRYCDRCFVRLGRGALWEPMQLMGAVAVMLGLVLALMRLVPITAGDVPGTVQEWSLVRFMTVSGDIESGAPATGLDWVLVRFRSVLDDSGWHILTGAAAIVVAEQVVMREIAKDRTRVRTDELRSGDAAINVEVLHDERRLESVALIHILFSLTMTFTLVMCAIAAFKQVVNEGTAKGSFAIVLTLWLLLETARGSAGPTRYSATQIAIDRIMARRVRSRLAALPSNPPSEWAQVCWFLLVWVLVAAALTALTRLDGADLIPTGAWVVVTFTAACALSRRSGITAMTLTGAWRAVVVTMAILANLVCLAAFVYQWASCAFTSRAEISRAPEGVSAVVTIVLIVTLLLASSVAAIALALAYAGAFPRRNRTAAAVWERMKPETREKRRAQVRLQNGLPTRCRDKIVGCGDLVTSRDLGAADPLPSSTGRARRGRPLSVWLLLAVLLRRRVVHGRTRPTRKHPRVIRIFRRRGSGNRPPVIED